MLNQILLYLGALALCGWGTAHLFPTRNVVAGFGNISADNQHIITMEWIIEGAALIFCGVLTAAITMIDPTGASSKTVYLLLFFFLNALSLISLMTGFKVNFLPFKLCPVIFSSASVLILLGGVILA